MYAYDTVFVKLCPAETVRLSRTDFECNTTIQFTFKADSAGTAHLPKISITNATTSTITDSWNANGTEELAAGAKTRSATLAFDEQYEAVFETDEVTNLATIKADVCKGTKCETLDIYTSIGLSCTKANFNPPLRMPD